MGSHNDDGTSTTTTLRQVIDSQLVLQSSIVIDYIVDKISGYDDRIDEYFDTLVAKYNTNNNNNNNNNRGRDISSVGDILIDKLLDYSGTIKFTKPKKYSF